MDWEEEAKNEISKIIGFKDEEEEKNKGVEGKQSGNYYHRTALGWEEQANEEIKLWNNDNAATKLADETFLWSNSKLDNLLIELTVKTLYSAQTIIVFSGSGLTKESSLLPLLSSSSSLISYNYDYLLFISFNATCYYYIIIKLLFFWYYA